MSGDDLMGFAKLPKRFFRWRFERVHIQSIQREEIPIRLPKWRHGTTPARETEIVQYLDTQDGPAFVDLAGCRRYCMY